MRFISCSCTLCLTQGGRTQPHMHTKNFQPLPDTNNKTNALLCTCCLAEAPAQGVRRRQEVRLLSPLGTLHSRPAQPLPPSSTTPAQLNHSHPAQPLPPSSSTPAQLIHSRPAHPLLLGFSTAPVSPDPAQFPLPPGSPTPTRFPRGLQLSLVWFPIPHLHSAPPLHHSPSNGAGLSLIISWRQKLSTMERIWSNFLH